MFEKSNILFPSVVTHVIIILANTHQLSLHGGIHMAVSYNNLWKLLIDKKMNKSELCKTVKISNISDIMEFTELEEIRKKLHS